MTGNAQGLQLGHLCEYWASEFEKKTGELKLKRGGGETKEHAVSTNAPGLKLCDLCE